MDETRLAPAAGGHVVLCGLNELGYRTLEELRRMGEEVMVVARAPTRELTARTRDLGAALVEGSYREESVLRSAAHDLNPDLPIRLRMFNQQLGRRVERLFPDRRVFDAAALAVPAFVSAALHHDWRQPLEVAGRRLVVRQASAADVDVVLPLARIRGDGTADLFPTDGDDLLCLAEARQQRPIRNAAVRGRTCRAGAGWPPPGPSWQAPIGACASWRWCLPRWSCSASPSSSSSPGSACWTPSTSR